MDKKTARFELRLTKQELTDLKAVAALKGVSASDFLRAQIRKTAVRMRK
jgi:predicted DNA binding CopG/RHH family protein